jgi:hypothetical protein
MHECLILAYPGHYCAQLFLSCPDDDSDNDRLGKHQSAKQSPRKSRTGNKADMRQQSNTTGVSSRLGKRLFGWLHPKFRYNGKRMVPSIHRVWSFMVSCRLRAAVSQHK